MRLTFTRRKTRLKTLSYASIACIFILLYHLHLWAHSTDVNNEKTHEEQRGIISELSYKFSRDATKSDDIAANRIAIEQGKRKIYLEINEKSKGGIREIHSNENQGNSLKSIGKIKRDGAKLTCGEGSITRKNHTLKTHEGDIACNPHKTPENACRYTEQAYKIDSTLQTCADNVSDIYCLLKRKDSLHFACKNIERYKSCKISGLNRRTGEIQTLRSVEVLSQLTMHLRVLAKVSIAERSSFLFLQCFPSKPKRRAQKVQLILLPLHSDEKMPPGEYAKLNINIILLDSVSRAHFYRSLPVVIKTFNEINKNQDLSAEVLDFELFQSVHGHSAENFHAFFTGTLLPSNMAANEKERAKVGVANLYLKMKEAGYETMYQDDLCWKHWWGIRMELGMAEDWKSLQREIKESSIDYTGLTFSSCKILELNNLKTPFNGPENDEICLNGRFQHGYIFDHLLEYYKENRRRKPRIGFTIINTGHDYKGLRVQTLNIALSNMVTDLALMRNTLTILMADHGNTYTPYTSDMLEGRFEMHHPSFFMIIPDGVKKWLGDPTMNNLRENTKRLFTMKDVHKTILGILGRSKEGTFPKESGLFSLIPADRTCDDLELALPNLCVCEGWDTPTKNDTRQIGVLEFAVGTLNELIDSQIKSFTVETTSIQRQCDRIFARTFRNVRERNDGDDLITSMDFTVKSGPGSGQFEEIFHVEVRSTATAESASNSMQLLSYDRISQYGLYRKCKDEGVNAKLCICSLKSARQDAAQNSLFENGELDLTGLLRLQPHYPGITSVRNLHESTESECIFVMTRDFVDDASTSKSMLTAVVEVINICKMENIAVYFDIETKNCKTSRNFPVTLEFEPGTISFLTVITRTVWHWDSSYRIFTSAVPDPSA